MRIFCRAVFFGAILCPLPLFAQLDTAWLRRFDGGARGEEIFSDMVLDRAGNVYIAGSATSTATTSDIIVQKYSPAGDLLWSATYDGRAHEDDSAAALVVDSLGQVYVCGWTIDTVFDIDMVTLKFSASGQLLWSRTWKRAFNTDDAATALCLDRLGRVIVTGYSTDGTGNTDYCTICYNGATGDTVWLRYYNRTPENDEDIAFSVCVDDSNNVYVTGTSYDDGTDYDIATIRYNPNGTRAWLRRKNNYPWVGDDYGMKVVFDPVTRTILLGGIVYDDNQDYNYFTMKYSRNGDSLWARPYNRYPANNEDLLYDLTVDTAGNVFVTGTSFDDVTDYDVATVSYTPNGVPRWTQRFDGAGMEDEGTDVVVDSLGQVLVLGNSDARTTIRDILVAKYTNDGGALYTYLWDSPFEHQEDLGYRIAVDRGHIYAGGVSFSDSTGYDLLLLKFYEVPHDFALVKLMVPDSLLVGDTLKPAAVVKNCAINRDSAWVRISVSTAGYYDSVWVVLNPGMADTLEFGEFVPESAGVFRVTAWCELEPDERHFNDTVWAEIVVWEESVAVAEPGQRLGVTGITIFPNPICTEGVLRFSNPPSGSVALRVYDRTGALVRKFTFPDAPQAGNTLPALKLDFRHLPAGVYFIKVDAPAGGPTKKVVVQH